MTTEFGHPMRKHFPFDEGFTNLNHGSFGSVPKSVLALQTELVARSESRPDAFLRYESVTQLNESRKALAALLQAPLSSIVMLQNATTGINTVLRNLKYKPDDVILYFSTSYGACQNIIHAATEFSGCKSHCIQLTFPMSDAALVEQFTTAATTLKQSGLNPLCLLLDTIISLPGIRMPFEALIQACKAHNVLSVLDGAHGYGHLPLNLSTLDPDFFVSNCHKWGFTPRPSAVFYVPERNQDLIRTTFPTSHYFIPQDSGPGKERFNPLPPAAGDDTAFTKQFEFVGTPGNAPYYCVRAALKFREEVCGGEAKIQEYCSKLAREGGQRVADILGTEIMDNEQGTLTKGCAMVNIRLPLAFAEPMFKAGDQLVSFGSKGPAGLTQWLQEESMKYDTFLPFYMHGEHLWTRLSAQVYLEMSDFERGGQVLSELCRRLTAGEHL